MTRALLITLTAFCIACTPAAPPNAEVSRRLSTLEARLLTVESWQVSANTIHQRFAELDRSLLEADKSHIESLSSLLSLMKMRAGGMPPKSSRPVGPTQLPRDPVVGQMWSQVQLHFPEASEVAAIRLAPSPDSDGWVSCQEPRTIYLRDTIASDSTPLRIGVVLAHELRHVVQCLSGSLMTLDDRQREADTAGALFAALWESPAVYDDQAFHSGMQVRPSAGVETRITKQPCKPCRQKKGTKS